MDHLLVDEVVGLALRYVQTAEDGLDFLKGVYQSVIKAFHLRLPHGQVQAGAGNRGAIELPYDPGTCERNGVVPRLQHQDGISDLPHSLHEAGGPPLLRVLLGCVLVDDERIHPEVGALLGSAALLDPIADGLDKAGELVSPSMGDEVSRLAKGGVAQGVLQVRTHRQLCIGELLLFLSLVGELIHVLKPHLVRMRGVRGAIREEELSG
mmetsp:Transcript_117349/g.373902  ORF Transcript_117349/g.373902 Transcript_117349/m.373902 type:complete len:209 (-) Transcript_117349:794-1420(-)